MMTSHWRKVAVWFSSGEPVANARFGGGFEPLGERAMPATYVVSLPAGYVATGVAGDAAATYSGNGYTLVGNGQVTTDSPASAIQKALTGSETVTLNNAAGQPVSDSYTFGANGTATVGTAAASHLNFVATASPITGDPNRWQLALDDLSSAKFRQAFGAPDYDYTDHFWYVDVTTAQNATPDATRNFTGLPGMAAKAYHINISATLSSGAVVRIDSNVVVNESNVSIRTGIADTINAAETPLVGATTSDTDGNYRLTLFGVGNNRIAKIAYQTQTMLNGPADNTLPAPTLTAASAGVTVTINGK